MSKIYITIKFFSKKDIVSNINEIYELLKIRLTGIYKKNIGDNTELKLYQLINTTITDATNRSKKTQKNSNIDIIDIINSTFEFKNTSIDLDIPLSQIQHSNAQMCIELAKGKNKLMTNSQNVSNCCLINIERDKLRYHHATNQLEILGINNFYHLKATYWRETDNFNKDLQLIINFLKEFDTKISIDEIKMNEFSEVNDDNINIQEGPLGCYCSHIRALIYGYLNFNDYVIIAEDDLLIMNSDNIKLYLKEIPKDWDIITLGSIPLNLYKKEPYYKYKNIVFHSLHFYIVKISALEFIFENLYPITKQIDLKLSDLVNKLNIYNIPNTILQKNFSTNTQNNLHEIYTKKKL